MNLKGLTAFTERGLVDTITEKQQELDHLKMMLDKLRDGAAATEKNLAKAWVARKIKPKKRELSRKQLLAMRRNAAIARHAIAAKKQGET